ncbi:MAG TPA: ion transporter [Thermoanaerobaculia bacterium]|nr:ion transporter [Thermoanaerobaculia bacterium]
MLEPPAPEAVERERFEILQQLEDWLEVPLLILGFAWLALLVVELTYGLTPLLETASTVIWIVFLVDFGAKLLLAPRKLRYLRTNWLTALALLVPALRVLRFARVLRLTRAVRGVRLFRMLTSLNRGMRALRASLRRRGVAYVTLLTLLVALVGAAGMYAFESPAEGGRIESYGEALWWTAMLLTTLGSEEWPQTGAGRTLCFALALYAFAVFGYLTAALASYFVDRDAEAADSAVAGEQALRALHAEVAALRAEIRALGPRPRFPEGPGEEGLRADGASAVED